MPDRHRSAAFNNLYIVWIDDNASIRVVGQFPLRRWAGLSVHGRLGRLALCYTGLGLLTLWVGGTNGWTIVRLRSAPGIRDRQSPCTLSRMRVPSLYRSSMDVATEAMSEVWSTNATAAVHLKLTPLTN